MSLRRNKKSSILFLYKKGRKERILDNKKYPSEFFYGYKELQKDLLELEKVKEEEENIVQRKVHF